MDRDLRIYTYGNGSLKKLLGNKHKHKNMRSVYSTIAQLWKNKARINFQYVVVEYYEPYDSKIIKTFIHPFNKKGEQ